MTPAEIDIREKLTRLDRGVTERSDATSLEGYVRDVKWTLDEIDTLRAKVALAEQQRDELRVQRRDTQAKLELEAIDCGEAKGQLQRQREDNATLRQSLEQSQKDYQRCREHLVREEDGCDYRQLHKQLREKESRIETLTQACYEAKNAILWLKHHREPTGGQPDRALDLIEKSLEVTPRKTEP